jgi:hypothetical protein
MTFISLALPLAPALAAVAVRLFVSVSEVVPNDSLDLNGMRRAEA